MSWIERDESSFWVIDNVYFKLIKIKCTVEAWYYHPLILHEFTPTLFLYSLLKLVEMYQIGELSFMISRVPKDLDLSSVKTQIVNHLKSENEENL